jgi:hypothetical protein
MVREILREQDLGLGSGSSSASVGTAYAQTSVPTAPAAKTATPASNLIIVGRQNYFPLDYTLGLTSKKSEASFIGKIINQGHAFVIVVDPQTKIGHRYDFGRYKEAHKCADNRLLSQAAKAANLQAITDGAGLHTMGVTVYTKGSIPAQVSADGKHITNLPQFLGGIKRTDDSPGNVVVIPVTDCNSARTYANNTVGKCSAYAIPGFSFLTSEDSMNCGIFALRVLNAGTPKPGLSIAEKTVLDTPDNLYQTLIKLGFQTSAF